jgi:hypothetical protein
MRTLLVLLLLTGIANADAKRECHFHDPKTKVTNLGCFDDIKSSNDHTYGTRVCLVRAANKCSGVMWLWDGDIEGTSVVLEDVTCRGAAIARPGSAGARSTPEGSAQSIDFFGTHDEGATIHLMNFTGKLAKRVLRGSFKKGKAKKTVAWKQTPPKEIQFDAAARIVALTRDVCAPGTAP